MVLGYSDESREGNPELPGASGLAVSFQQLPLFDDGVETGDTIRWSATVP